MSKFFNETRSVQPITPSPAPAEINIQELVGSLR